MRGEYKVALEKKAVVLEKTGKYAVLDRAADEALTDSKVALAKAEAETLAERLANDDAEAKDVAVTA